MIRKSSSHTSPNGSPDSGRKSPAEETVELIVAIEFAMDDYMAVKDGDTPVIHDC